MGSQCGSACIICIFPWQERKKKKKRVIIYIFGPSLYLLLRSGKNCDEWKTKSFSASLFSAIFSVFVLPVRSSLPKQRVTLWKLIWNVSWALSECRSHNIKLKVVVDNINLLYCDPLSMRGGRPSPRFEPIHTGSDVYGSLNFLLTGSSNTYSIPKSCGRRDTLYHYYDIDFGLLWVKPEPSSHTEFGQSASSWTQWQMLLCWENANYNNIDFDYVGYLKEYLQSINTFVIFTRSLYYKVTL